ncbi:MAG TPA: acetyl-CoA C-acyltransferase, partial [Spirochaetes bacterium]|nr:acetyl-CoA C-acyltransferase [Spirochaetota bacterium]
MKDVVIVDAVRTPLGKGNTKTGYYRHVRGDELAVQLVKSLLERNPFDASLIEDVIIGCVMQQDENGLNVARQISLQAGIPIEASAVTVNRLCGSSMQALHQAVQAIMIGNGDVYIVGGLEHMGHIPMEKGLNPNPKLFKHYSKAVLSMGISTEFLAMKYGISREHQDEFALKSNLNAVSAYKEGRFKKEVIPVMGHLEDGNKALIDRDQGPREDTTL